MCHLCLCRFQWASLPDCLSVRVLVMYPTQCREGGDSYCGPLDVRLCRQLGDGPVETVVKRLGEVPIMVKVRADSQTPIANC